MQYDYRLLTENIEMPLFRDVNNLLHIPDLPLTLAETEEAMSLASNFPTLQSQEYRRQLVVTIVQILKLTEGNINGEQGTVLICVAKTLWIHTIYR